LKAIHNGYEVQELEAGAVLNISKIQFESNSQLNVCSLKLPVGCAQYLKDTI